MAKRKEGRSTEENTGKIWGGEEGEKRSETTAWQIWGERTNEGHYWYSLWCDVTFNFNQYCQLQ